MGKKFREFTVKIKSITAGHGDSMDYAYIASKYFYWVDADDNKIESPPTKVIEHAAFTELLEITESLKSGLKESLWNHTNADCHPINEGKIEAFTN